LAGWRGVGALKASLQALAGGQPGLPVLLAARSAALMRLAARLLFHPCRRVLTVDLGWPGYHAALEAEARRAGRAVSVVPLLDDVLAGRVGADEIVERVRAECLSRSCDGLFLPAVSSHGVRLPVERVVRTIEAAREPRFVVVDGAQEFCHAPAQLASGCCDLYLAGCHKWLGGYHPMGVAFYGRPRSASFVDTVVAHLDRTGELDDPLLRFTDGLERGRAAGVDETVNLAPLFTGHGAAGEAVCSPPSDRFAARVANAERAGESARGAGWEPLRPDRRLRSGILLLRPLRPEARARPAGVTRAAFAAAGVVLTAYEGGLVRLSMPDAPWSGQDLADLVGGLRWCA
jgi:hypothetical protein